MQSLFRLENDLSAGSYYLRQWPYVKQGLLQNIEKIENFYQKYTIAAPSSHVLARLITAVNISRNLPFERYVANATHSSMNVAQALKMTTPSSKGKVWDGDFYGQGSSEIIIAHTDYFNLSNFQNNWKSMQPVKVLCHNQTNTEFLIPDGKTNSMEKGVAIIAVNVPMLMAMYYCFNYEQDIKFQKGLPRETVEQFVHGYALTNMIRSHADCVMLNRLYASSIGTPVMPALRKHSFFTTNYDDALEKVVEEQNKYVRYMQAKITAVLRSVHTPCSENMLESSVLPKVPQTMQCYWALVASRLKFLAYVCATQKDAFVESKSELANIAWQMKILQTKQVMKNALGLEGYYHLAPLMDKAKI